MKKCEVYKIKFDNVGKFYIGSSKNPKRRWQEHLNDLVKNKHHNFELQNDYNKRGEVTKEVLFTGTLEECREIEQLVIDSWYESLYNYSKSSTYCKVPATHILRKNTSDRFLGKEKKLIKASDETKSKMRETRKGLKMPQKCTDASKKYLSVRVEQYSLDGVLINTFDSVTEAGKEFHYNGQKNISKALSGAQKTAYGFIWKSLGKVEKEEKVFNHRYMNCFITRYKTVSVNISADGVSNFLGTYDTQKEALEVRNNFIINNNLQHLLDVIEYKGE